MQEAGFFVCACVCFKFEIKSVAKQILTCIYPHNISLDVIYLNFMYPGPGLNMYGSLFECCLCKILDGFVPGHIRGSYIA